MRRRGLLGALLGSLLLVSGVAEGAIRGTTKLRVRKELRSMSQEEYAAFIVGLSTMLQISTASGRRLFGPKYISYPEMLIKHAVATNDPRGDQGHNGPQFMTFHRAFLLEVEESLLSVAPRMGALPYWDITLDNIGAKYHNTPNAIFSEKYAGATNGDSRVAYGVTNGVFAWRQVSRFIPAQWKQYLKVYNGSVLGFTRSFSNKNINNLVTRYPTQNLVKLLKANSNSSITTSLPFAKLPSVSFLADDLISNGQLQLNYPAANYNRCLNPQNYTSWMEWSFCVDVTVLSEAPDSVDKQKYISREVGSTALLHAAPHWTTGGIGVDPTAEGDMFDVATSPNEPLLFPIHHANIDRSAMTWQAAAAKLDPSMVSKYWLYPQTKAEYSTAVSGALLDDVINNKAGFTTQLFEKKPANAKGYTHKEVLFYTRPGASPYTYDTLLS